uniref:Uncharacterized protein n=1 Tax=Cebus imitator TaxID=2715852 RepID=A0A2K5QDZ4_CEBIM
MDQYVPTAPPQFPITQLGTFKQDSTTTLSLWEHSRSTLNDTTFLYPGLHTMDFTFSR